MKKIKEFLLSAKDNKSVIVVSILAGGLVGFIISKIDNKLEDKDKEIKRFQGIIEKYESQNLDADTIVYANYKQYVK